jgi:NAD(P)H-nitrite reductase large subunit
MDSAKFSENVLDAPPDEIVCWCSSVTKKTLIEAIRSGATDMAAIRSATTACTKGRCKELSPRRRCCSPDIQKLIDNYSNREERKS